MVRLISEFQSWDRSAVAAGIARVLREPLPRQQQSWLGLLNDQVSRPIPAGAAAGGRPVSGARSASPQDGEVRHAAVRRPAGRRFPSGPARAGDGACHRRHHQDKRRCDRQCRQAFVAGRGRRGRRDTPGGGAGFAGRVRQAGRLRGRPGQDHRRPPAAGSSRDPYGGAGVAGRREQRGGEAGFLLPRVHTPGRERAWARSRFPPSARAYMATPGKRPRPSRWPRSGRPCRKARDRRCAAWCSVATTTRMRGCTGSCCPACASPSPPAPAAGPGWRAAGPPSRLRSWVADEVRQIGDMPAGGHANAAVARFLSGLAGRRVQHAARVAVAGPVPHAAGHVLQSGRIGAVAAEGRSSTDPPACARRACWSYSASQRCAGSPSSADGASASSMNAGPAA